MTAAPYRPSTAHAELGPGFFDVVEPARFPQAIPRWRNRRWDARVGLADLDGAAWERRFARFEPLPGSFAKALALRYHGHQFGVYNPDIGDGRGFLFAQLYDDRDRLLDLGTKGSGTTPYSRQGDGRLTLKGGMREILATEMLEAQGVDTSKSFSLFETGEALTRGDEPSPTRSSVLVRLSHSHVRIGTFQRFLAEGDRERIAKLIAHCVRYYVPEAARSSTEDEAVAFYEAVVRNVARLAASWMCAGFVHGVLNTDNTNVTGESFDYGPWRWLPRFDPSFTAAYFDHGGLYAFGRQPHALKWNLARLGECLLMVAPMARIEPALESYDRAFHAALGEATLKRLGVARIDAEASGELAAAIFAFLQGSAAPFELVWFDWRGGAVRRAKAMAGPNAHLYRGKAFDRFLEALERHAPAPDANAGDPYFAADRPCTMLIEEVEALWEPIAGSDDWSAFHAKIEAIDAMRRAYGNG